MAKISAIITAAGKNSRMEKDQLKKKLPIKNKLLLPLHNRTLIENTINNVLSSNINECIIVLGHFSDEIEKIILNIDDDRIQIVKNNPIEVGLSQSLLNGINKSNGEIVLCVAGDQPSVSKSTYNNIIDCILNSKFSEKTISILRRRKIGLLKTVKGLGMPFAANKIQLAKYLENENDNLNPILKKMFENGFIFFAIKEENEYELININRHEDYNLILNNL
ncbi:MAG: NTP transferase domain-containing protein [Methanobacteriaceae archaeon]|jgi:molybdenum cofactor cytidylyltransferase|nr:NTP transferase domain-containing protein [Candidatus Methanorudis spinitermitis]